MSHVVHYGSGVFEGMRCYETPTGGAVFRLGDHLRRLIDSARIHRLPVPWTVEQLAQATLDVVAANDLRECYLRPLVVRTGQQMGINPAGVPVECFIIPWRWGTYLGAEALEQGVDVCVSSWRRAAPDTFPTMAKATANYVNSQLAKVEAKQDGYAEAVMLDSHGYVSEGSGENLFVLRQGVLLTAPLTSAILEGITRDSVIRLARDLAVEVRERPLQREELYLADEMFLCGTAAEITPIRSVDRIPVGAGTRGPLTAEIQRRYLGIARGRLPDPYGWLTPVPVGVAAG